MASYLHPLCQSFKKYVSINYLYSPENYKEDYRHSWVYIKCIQKLQFLNICSCHCMERVPRRICFTELAFPRICFIEMAFPRIWGAFSYFILHSSRTKLRFGCSHRMLTRLNVTNDDVYLCFHINLNFGRTKQQVHKAWGCEVKGEVRRFFFICSKFLSAQN